MNRFIYSAGFVFTFFLTASVPTAFATGSFTGIDTTKGGKGSPGTGSLSGKITEQDGGPLIGATVYIPDLKLGVVTDTSGYYKFNSLPSGRYLIEVHSIGFKTFTKTVTISGPITQDFALTDE